MAIVSKTTGAMEAGMHVHQDGASPLVYRTRATSD